MIPLPPPNATPDEVLEFSARLIEENDILDHCGILASRKRDREDAALRVATAKEVRSRCAARIRAFMSREDLTVTSVLRRLSALSPEHNHVAYVRDAWPLAIHGLVDITVTTSLASNSLPPESTYRIALTERGQAALAETAAKSAAVATETAAITAVAPTLASDGHCCVEMARHVADGETAIHYSAQFREYGISVLDGGSSFIQIAVCPWCGARLPASLRDEWFARIEALEPRIDPWGDAVPTEFQSDAWWRSSGLEQGSGADVLVGLSPFDEDALARAADRLDAYGRHHHWWPDTIPEWRKLDPIGREEFLDLVAGIVTAYQSAARLPLQSTVLPETTP